MNPERYDLAREIRPETPRDRLVTLIKALAHPYAGADLVTWEQEALALVDQLLPLPRLTIWEWSRHRWMSKKR